MAVWYVQHDDELLLDLDHYERLTKNGGVHGEEFFRLRLQAAIESGRLHVRSVWLVPSTNEKHFHAIVRITDNRISVIERLVWQIHLGSDLYKGRADLMRAARGDLFPSLLIRAKPIERFYRLPDAVCECTEKHDTNEQWTLGKKACAVWQYYRGHTPWQLFGPSPAPQYRVRLPNGEVPLESIMQVVVKPEDEERAHLTEKRRAWLAETR